MQYNHTTRLNFKWNKRRKIVKWMNTMHLIHAIYHLIAPIDDAFDAICNCAYNKNLYFFLLFSIKVYINKTNCRLNWNLSVYRWIENFLPFCFYRCACGFMASFLTLINTRYYCLNWFYFRLYNSIQYAKIIKWNFFCLAHFSEIYAKNDGIVTRLVIEYSSSIKK